MELTTEQQDLAWKYLPKVTRDEIKAEYHSGLNNPRMNKCDSVYLTAFENIFGKHNLEFDTEPEEMLMVKRKKLQEMYPHYNNHNTFNRGVIYALNTLFGNKCLPDIPNTPNSGELKSETTENEKKSKFNVGDKVVPIKGNPDYIGKVAEVLSVNEEFACIVFDNGEQSSYSVSFLEPYAEEYRNLSQNPTICDKSKPNPLNDMEECPYTDRTCESCMGKGWCEYKSKDNMEEKELNLCELLKGCEGDKFFSSVHGEVTFYEKAFSQEDKYHLFFEKQNGESFYTLWNGTFGRGIYPIIFPSRALYEKYPLEPSKAWAEWAESRKHKRWRAKQGESHWFIEPTGEISNGKDNYFSDCDNCWMFGNYFRTASEAKQAAEEVRKCLESFHNRKEGEQ